METLLLTPFVSVTGLSVSTYSTTQQLRRINKSENTMCRPKSANRANRIRTYKCKNQNLVPYLLAIALYSHFPPFISLVLNPTAFAIKPKTFLKDFVKLLSFRFRLLALGKLKFEFSTLISKLYDLSFTAKPIIFDFKSESNPISVFNTIILPTEL